MSVRIEPAAWDDDDVQRLTAAQQAELRARYDGKKEPGSPPTAADVSVVLVARDAAGRAVGCGALRAPRNGVAEIKRMYAVPAHRGQGVSRAVLRALEECARASGWTTVRLETGPRQPEAVGLYRSAGYRPIGAFGIYVGGPAAVDSLFFERRLGQAGTDQERSPTVG